MILSVPGFTEEKQPMSDQEKEDGIELSDQDLVEKIRAGDEDAATELYHRYSKRIHGLVASRMANHLRSQLQPEDIVQSVFKSIFRGVQGGGYTAPEGGSLWQLMAVVAVRKVQRNGAKRTKLKRDSRRNQPLDFVEEIDDKTESPEQFELALQEATEALGEDERLAVLHRVQGFTVEEISTRMERSRRSVERLLKSARERLSELLNEE